MAPNKVTDMIDLLMVQAHWPNKYSLSLISAAHRCLSGLYGTVKTTVSICKNAFNVMGYHGDSYLQEHGLIKLGISS